MFKYRLYPSRSQTKILEEQLELCHQTYNWLLARARDAGWGRFIGMIAYKEEESGGQLIQLDANGTTQRCSRCGETVPKGLSQRIHRYLHCGLVLDRDLNAALNVLGRGREIGREPPEYTPVGEETAIQPQFVEQVSSMNQEASLLVGR